MSKTLKLKTKLMREAIDISVRMNAFTTIIAAAETRTDGSVKPTHYALIVPAEIIKELDKNLLEKAFPVTVALPDFE